MSVFTGRAQHFSPEEIARLYPDYCDRAALGANPPGLEGDHARPVRLVTLIAAARHYLQTQAAALRGFQGDDDEEDDGEDCPRLRRGWHGVVDAAFVLRWGIDHAERSYGGIIR